MKMRIPRIAIVILAVGVTFTGCLSFEKFYHRKIIYGEIIEIKGDEIVFCIGERKNVVIGQEYHTFDLEKKRILPTPAGRQITTYSFDIKDVGTGTVRVVSYLLDRYARAIIIRGSISINDFVDIKR